MHVELLAKVKAVWTAKQKLDREEAALKDCLADLEHAAVNKKSLKDIVSDFSKKMQLLHDLHPLHDAKLVAPCPQGSESGLRALENAST